MKVYYLPIKEEEGKEKRALSTLLISEFDTAELDRLAAAGASLLKVTAPDEDDVNAAQILAGALNMLLEEDAAAAYALLFSRVPVSVAPGSHVRGILGATPVENLMGPGYAGEVLTVHHVLSAFCRLLYGIELAPKYSRVPVTREGGQEAVAYRFDGFELRQHAMSSAEAEVYTKRLLPEGEKPTTPEEQEQAHKLSGLGWTNKEVAATLKSARLLREAEALLSAVGIVTVAAQAKEEAPSGLVLPDGSTPAPTQKQEVSVMRVVPPGMLSMVRLIDLAVTAGSTEPGAQG